MDSKRAGTKMGSFEDGHPFDVRGELEKALLLHQSGRIQEARAIYEKILEIDRDHSDALHLLGFAAHQTGNNAAACDLISRAVRIHPEYPFYHNSLGLVLKDQGKFEEAIACYRKALELQPDMTEAYNNLGVLFQGCSRFEESIACYEKALAKNPDSAELHNNLGNSLRDLHRFEEALLSYKKALKIKADYAEAFFNMGTTYQELNQLNDAVACYQKALDLRPDYAEAAYNMGNAYHGLDQLSEALCSYEKAVNINPSYTDALDNMGKVYEDMGRIDDAISCYDRSLKLKPESADTRFDRSLLLLLKGDLLEGFKEYEWRFLHSGWKRTYPHRFDKPRWDGLPFKGKRLFVHAEQGLGDTIQFARYLPMVKDLGGKLIFEVKKPLLKLFLDFPGIDELRLASSTIDPIPDFDLYIPLLSIPRLVETTLTTIPSQVPYIYADSQKVKLWQTRFGGGGFKVGIVWAGSPTNNDDRNRSCELENFFLLFQIPGIKIYGLQKGEAIAQLGRLPKGMVVTSLGEEFEDFSDTAAVIENLDLVISVDTACAHLAGAMGKDVWTLLPFAPDWRWLMHRTDTPWYPTMRLFRQPDRGNWKTVFQTVAQELRNLVQAG